MRCRLDWNDSEDVELWVESDWRRWRCHRPHERRGWGDVRVLAPWEASVITADRFDWKGREERLRRCAKRGLVESLVQQNSRYRAAAFADEEVTRRLKGDHRAVPAVLALAALARLFRWGRSNDAGRWVWTDGRHSLEAWSRRGRWCPPAAEPAWSLVIEPGVNPAFAPATIPLLSPREWLLLGAVRAERSPGSFPPPSPPWVRRHARRAATVSLLGLSVAATLANEVRGRRAEEDRAQAQRELERLRSGHSLDFLAQESKSPGIGER